MAAVTFALLAVVGLAPARVVARSRPWAVALTPVTGALGCAAAASLCVLTRTSMVPWLVALTVAGWIALGVARRHTVLANEPDTGAAVVLLAAAVVALVPVVMVDLPATVSDARSIWWLHAAWFRAGGSLAADAMHDPAYGGSLPAHPPLVPSVVAAVWHLDGAYDREVALRVSQLLTACAAAALGFVTARVLRLTGAGGALVAAGVTWLAWSAKVSVGLDGLLDLTWALLLAAGAVLWLAGDTGRRTIAAGALFVAAAMLTKSEGQVGALLLAPLATVRLRSAWPRAAIVVGTVVAAAAMWRLVITPSRYDTGDLSRLPELVQPGSAGWERMTTALGDFAGQLGPLGWLGVALVVAVVALGRDPSARVRQPGLLAILVLAAGVALANAAVFALRPEEMDALLHGASYRTIIVVRLLVLVDVVLALVAAERALRTGRSAQDPGTAGAGSGGDHREARTAQFGSW